MSGLWRAPAPLVLASGSAARRMLLEGAGIPLEIIRPEGVDEAALARDLVAQGATAIEVAAALARAKGEAVSERQPGRLVLAADQTLDLDGHLGMKAPDLAAARAQLLAMRGREHRLHSAAVLLRDGAVIWQGTASATLEMRAFSDDFLASYLAQMGNRVLDTVGCYELEALGPHLFARIEGEHATILGLPLFGVLTALRAAGALIA